jgi:hypothetical protein
MKRKFENNYMGMLWRMVEFGTIEEEDLDREAGRFFGYSKCCVDNYIAITKSGFRGVAKYMIDLFGPDDLQEILNKPHVRCSKCRRISKW